MEQVDPARLGQPHLKAALLAVALAFAASGAHAGHNTAGSDDRWNISGPAWYQTPCGHVGFSPTHGVAGTGKYVRPCSVPIRVCEFKNNQVMSYPADPDVPCEEMIRPLPDGGVQKTYLRRWD
jgi:hypothetical protein